MSKAISKICGKPEPLKPFNTFLFLSEFLVPLYSLLNRTKALNNVFEIGNAFSQVHQERLEPRNPVFSGFVFPDVHSGWQEEPR